MSLSENGNGLVMPVGPMYGNGSTNGFGWGDGSFWIIILFLFAFMGNGWGNWGGNSGTAQTVNNDLQRGFDQQAVMSNLSGINTTVTNGFANAEISRCNSQFNVIQSLNDMAAAFQNCCCENRAQSADLKYTVATEAAATRANDQANTQVIMDKLCQLELDGVKQNYESQIRGMQNQLDAVTSQLSEANTRAFVGAEVSRILSDNATQTATLQQNLNPPAIPAYVVQNPNCCGTGVYASCGCAAA